MNKEVFPQNKGELEKAGKYYKTLCQDHGRIETREYYLENEIDWMKDARKECKDGTEKPTEKMRLGQRISVSCTEQAELKRILFSGRSGNRVCLLYSLKRTTHMQIYKKSGH